MLDDLLIIEIGIHHDHAHDRQMIVIDYAAPLVGCRRYQVSVVIEPQVSPSDR